MSDNDDLPVGTILSRREAIALLGLASVNILAGCGKGASNLTAAAATDSTTSTATGTASCVVRPALTEGPYFKDEKLNRSDIRSDPTTGALRSGLPLVLTFNVSRVVNGA